VRCIVSRRLRRGVLARREILDIVPGDFAAFLGVSLLVIVVPGPDTALTIRNALLRGRRGGVLTAFGVSTGQAVWALLSAAGIASLLQASQVALDGLRIVGAAYLAYLGLRALASAVRGTDDGDHSPSPAAVRGIRRPSTYGQGLISNLANPKMVVFFLSLLPQFAGSRPHPAALLLLGLVFCALTFLWLASYAVVVARLGDVLRRPRVRRLINGVTGTALLAFGVRVAREHR
jgi:threonine/homoserine/homoserine lactone efflux protein